MRPPPGQALELLARVPLLRKLPEPMRRALASSLEERECAAGARIFERGAPGDRMYLVVEGEVDIDLPAEPGEPPMVLRRLKAGDYFGELALLAHHAGGIVVRLGKRGAQRDGPAVGGGRLLEVSGLPGGQHDPGAGFGEPGPDGQADPPVATRHDGHAILESEIHNFLTLNE